jgi:hypothetical protein
MIGNIGELVLAVWLVVRSVDGERWTSLNIERQAREAQLMVR